MLRPRYIRPHDGWVQDDSEFLVKDHHRQKPSHVEAAAAATTTRTRLLNRDQTSSKKAKSGKGFQL